jgi:SAM-dependent methyltransferase
MRFTPIDHYDPASGGHSGLRETVEPRERAAIELARPVVDGRGSGGVLLDIGCGTGVFLATIDSSCGLTRRGWTLHGVDYSEAQVREARRHPYAFSQCNVEEGLPFGDAEVDLMFCGELIEHLYDPDAFLEECRRVIAPGGHLIVTTPNLQAWYNRVLFAAGIQPLFYETSTRSTHIGAGPLRRFKRGSTPVGHIRVLNKRALHDLLESQGFLPVAERGAIFPVFPGPVQFLDRLFDRVPSLASNLVVLSRRDAEPPHSG